MFLEAASAGKPVIAGNSGGVAEAVQDGTTGMLVSGVDEAELGRAITTLAEDVTLRVRMGAAGRQRVKESFTWDAAAVAVAALHTEAAGG